MGDGPGIIKSVIFASLIKGNIMFVNPWWSHHCAGNLKPKNDPYSEDYEYPFSGVPAGKFILIVLAVFAHTAWYGCGLYWLTVFCQRTESFVWFIPIFIPLICLYAYLNVVTVRLILK